MDMNRASLEKPKPFASAGKRFHGLPSSIWALGLVSMFMDISSELVHGLLPVFMASTLGASVSFIGLLEGVAEATASITKVFSGVISDYVRKRKILVVLGYGLSAMTKPLFPLAASIGWVFTGRFVDRIGKGVRDAPRDALVADIISPALRGAAYGLRQALDSVGAFLGPLLAVALMVMLANDIRSVLWVAVIPAFVAVALLVFAVHEPERPQPNPGERPPFSFAGAGKLHLRYWLVVGLGAVFTLARFSEAFLILRARSVGLSIAFVPVVMVVMNISYAGAAYPAGAAADRFRPRWLLLVGLGMLVLADVVLAAAVSPLHVFGGAILWGLHMALTQGLFSKLVADASPEGLRGTAFGIFNLVSGAALLAASVVAGYLWDAVGPQATFWTGACFAAIAGIGLISFRPAADPVGSRRY